MKIEIVLVPLTIILSLKIVAPPVSSFEVRNQYRSNVYISTKQHISKHYISKHFNNVLTHSSQRCCHPAYVSMRYNKFLHSRTNHHTLAATVNNEYDIKAEDLEAIQSLFSKYCDPEGLMTKEVAMKVPAIAELMVRSMGM